ncbi:MAG: hypothetical protein M3457_03875 [Chloroflexota bacterium]|nr:hypothetical protein [Chloroflexota bacterium]
MSRQNVTITIGASVFDARGERIGSVTGVEGGIVTVSGQSIPESAFVRADDAGIHLGPNSVVASTGGEDQGASATPDATATEQELMDRSVEEARAIEAPPPATGTLADPVAGSGFTRHQPAGENLLGDTTVSQPFEDLGDLGDLDGADGDDTDTA